MPPLSQKIDHVFFDSVASPTRCDAVVLGGGAAGLTSALYLARAGFSTYVLEGPSPGGAITQSNQVYNWPGYPAISGLDLMGKIRAQAQEAGARILEERATKVNLSSRPFLVFSEEVDDPTKKRKIEAKACIIALGSQARKLNVPGEDLYFSRGVYTCAVCDGALYKGKTVAVVGGGDGALSEAEYLAGLAEKVYILNRKSVFKGIEKTRKERVLAHPRVKVLYDVNVGEIKGNGKKVHSIDLIKKGGCREEIFVDALFLAIGSVPNTDIFRKQLKMGSKGHILQKNCETSVPGVFAGGDVADPRFQQAIIASGEGAKAAFLADEYLRLSSSAIKSLSNSVLGMKFCFFKEGFARKGKDFV